MRLFEDRPTTAHGHRSQASDPLLGPTSAKKFALLASISAQARKNSPNTGKTAQNGPIFASRASFFAAPPRIQARWASFFAPTGAAATSKHPPTTSPETDDTNVGGSLTRNETADTSARTKPPILGHLSAAKASPVTCTPRRTPAKASPVSSAVESVLLVLGKVLRCSCLLPPSQSW